MFKDRFLEVEYLIIEMKKKKLTGRKRENWKKKRLKTNRLKVKDGITMKEVVPDCSGTGEELVNREVGMTKMKLQSCCLWKCRAKGKVGAEAAGRSNEAGAVEDG